MTCAYCGGKLGAAWVRVGPKLAAHEKCRSEPHNIERRAKEAAQKRERAKYIVGR